MKPIIRILIAWLSVQRVAIRKPAACWLLGLACLSLGPSRALATQLVWDPLANGSGTAGSGNWDNTAGNAVWWNGTTDLVWSSTGNSDTPADGATFLGPDAAAGTYVVNLDAVEVDVNSLIISNNGYAFTGASPIYLAKNDTLWVATNKTVTFNCSMAASATSPFWVLGSGATMNIASNIMGGQIRLAGPPDSAFNLTGSGSAPGIMFVLGPVNITSGSITPTSTFQIGYPNPNPIGGASYTTGSVTVSGSSTAVRMNGNILIIGRSGGTGTLTINDGSVTVGDVTASRNCAIGYDTSGHGTVNVYGGTLNVGSSGETANAIDFFQAVSGSGGTAVLSQTAGTVNAWGGIQFGPNSGTPTSVSATLTLSGGALYVGARGISQVAAFNAGNGDTSSITLSGGTVGALASWLSAVPMTLGTANGNVTFQCADSSSNPYGITLSGALTGAGGLNITGTGTLTLSGANTYTGSTVVSNGTLVVSTATAPTNGPVTLDGSASSPALIVQSSAGQYWSIGTLSFPNGTPTASFQLGALSPSTSVAPLQVSGNVAFTATPTVNVGGTAIAVGTYPLIHYTGAVSGTMPTSVTTWTGGTASAGYLTNVTATKTIALVVTSSSYNPALYWRVGSGAWDINTTPNWSQFGAPITYTDGNAVIFDDSATGPSPITVSLNTTVNPLSVTANNATNSYIISGTGSIAGSGAVQVLGGGSLTLSTTNSYGGGTVVSAGQLNINNGGDPVNGSAIGTGPLTLNAGAALDNTSGADVMLQPNIAETWNGNFTYLGSVHGFNTGAGQITLGASLTISNAANNFIVGGTIADLGMNLQLSKTGPGTLTLAAPNSFAGGLNVYAGQLNITDPSALAQGPFTIYGGAIDNSSGADLTLNPPSSYSWAGNFSFIGSANLDLSYGTVTIPNGLGNITVNVISNTLSTEGNIINNNTRVTKTGNGTWEIAGSGSPLQSLALVVSAGQVNLDKSGGQAIQGGNNLGLTVQSGALVLNQNNDQIHSDSAIPIPVVLAGGTWDLNGFNENVDQLSLSTGGTLRNGAPTSTSTLTAISGYTAMLTGPDCQFDVTASDATLNFNGVLGGTGSLVKLGAGVLNVNSNTTYTGNTTVSNGTLVLTYATLASTSTVTVNSNAVLQLSFPDTNTVGGLVLNGVSQPAGLYNAANTATYLAGTGNLLVVPTIPSTPTNITFVVSANTLALSWPSNYLGWILQTNVINVAVPGDWHDVPGSATNVQFSAPMTNPAEFFRLRYPQ